VWVPPEAFWATQGLAGAGALACAAAVATLVQRWPAQREALIGLVYVMGAALALLGARVDPHGRERLTALLAADVLWATPEPVLLLAATAAAVLLLRARLRHDAWFYALFALGASVAVPVLGLFVVFALLITPALWCRAGLSRAQAVAATVAACALGLALSWAWDAPSGACVALAVAAMGSASVAWRRPSTA
jgi:zinc/manganese transport system permease protein